jgi:preprotein translocase subunit YajC
MHSLSIFAATNSSSGGAAIVQLGIFLLIPVAMYFLLIRPQRRRQREQASLQKSVEIGDEVMTTSGVYGFVTGFDGDICWLEIDDNVQIRIARAAVQRKVDTSAGDTSGDNPTHKPDEGGGRPAGRSTTIADVVVDDADDK